MAVSWMHAQPVSQRAKDECHDQTANDGGNQGSMVGHRLYVKAEDNGLRHTGCTDKRTRMHRRIAGACMMPAEPERTIRYRHFNGKSFSVRNNAASARHDQTRKMPGYTQKIL